MARPLPQREPVASNKQPAKAGRVNLLAPENGGEILVASSERWVAIIDGNFTSLGTFKTQNVRNMKQPFQAFRFSPVKAKFLKFRSLKASGAAGAVKGYEFQLLGMLDD